MSRHNMIILGGELFDLSNPRPELIKLKTIARALSNQCRYNGQTEKPYSVAQHSCHVFSLCKDMGFDFHTQQWALLHDAAEAYVGDIIQPIKWKLNGFKRMEHIILMAITNKYGLSTPAPMGDVSKADRTAMYLEMKYLYPEADWEGPVMARIKDQTPPAFHEHVPLTSMGVWSADKAYENFLIDLDLLGFPIDE